MSEDFPALILGSAKIFLGDCRDALKLISDNSIDSIVTDPPYELGFMGKKWDNSGIAYDVSVWQECLRVLKPGGHILAFGGSRTYHRLGVAIEDAGFEIRDTIAWISSKTFPKSLNVEKAIEKAGMDGSVASGWGTGLKQVVEPVVMARKPLEGTVAENTLRWGVGGINIDGSRIGTETVTINTFDNGAKPFGGAVGEPFTSRQSRGRWPANVILDEVSARLLDEQSGVTKSQISNRGDVNFGHFGGYAENEQSLAEHTATIRGHSDTGGASRFFYVAKASKRDRNEGIEIANFHPTVKPTALMCYLIKLVTPPGGTVLDPFTGSGSTGKAALLDGFNFIGVELTEEYLPIIKGRLKAAIKEKERDNDGLF
jgi:DNA modification methylase